MTHGISWRRADCPLTPDPVAGQQSNWRCSELNTSSTPFSLLPLKSETLLPSPWKNGGCESLRPAVTIRWQGYNHVTSQARPSKLPSFWFCQPGTLSLGTQPPGSQKPQNREANGFPHSSRDPVSAQVAASTNHQPCE